MVVLSQQQKSRFIELACQLSPENLSCDGEATPAEVNCKLREIMTEWAILEREVGSKVTHDMVGQWMSI